MKMQDNKASFRIFWLASLIAAIGSGMTSFGIGVYVFETTDSAFIKSMISLVGFLPTVLMSPFAGLLADRYDRRKLMILADGLSSLGVLLILYALQFAESSILLVGFGVCLSAIFSALIEPAAKSTVSDMLSEEDYTKASGYLQLAGSARFLVSPVMAALIMSKAGLKGILIIDLLTILTTISAIMYISKGLEVKSLPKDQVKQQNLRQGFDAIKANVGLKVLVFFTVLLTFMVGTIQELSTPLVLSFTDARSLSLMITLAAFGLVLSSFYLGIREIKGNMIRKLSFAAFVAGLAMMGFGFQENVWMITIFGFLFFATLPFMNAILDYLIRVNISNALQGRVFGIIGTISQIGYVIAYGISGLASDWVFRPLLREDGPLAASLGLIMGLGPGRGIGLFILCQGFLLILVAVLMVKNQNLSSLKGVSHVKENCTK